MCDRDFDLKYSEFDSEEFKFANIQNRLVISKDGEPVKVFRYESMKQDREGLNELLQELLKEIEMNAKFIKTAEILGITDEDSDNITTAEWVLTQVLLGQTFHDDYLEEVVRESMTKKVNQFILNYCRINKKDK